MSLDQASSPVSAITLIELMEAHHVEVGEPNT